jgi:transcription initiation factor IIE alpha subunit
MDTTVVVVVLGAAAILVTGVVLFLRRRGKEDDSFYHFRCPKCQRRLRYLARQVGHKGKCMNCNGDVIFPPISQSID